MGSGRTARRRRRNVLSKIGFALVAFSAAGLVASGVVSGADQPTIASDQSDYALGATVSLTGSGWQAGEPVQVVVDDDQNDPWSHTADLTAASDSAVSDSFDLPTGLAGTFTVTATAASGTASTTFTATAPAPPPAPAGRSISSDKSEYAFGDTVALSGSGWQAGETVQVVVDDDQDDPWTHTAGLTAATDGAVSDSFDLPTDLTGTFTVTATAPSGSATATFTVAAPAPSGPPTISADKDDYQPGDTVVLTGAGWRSGETVHIVVDDVEGQSWTREADVTAASDGTLTDTFVLPDQFVATYTVTATGPLSGTVTTTFRDSLSGYYEGTAATGTCTSGGNALTSDDNRATCSSGQNVVVSGFGLDGIVPATAANIQLNVEVEASRTGGAQSAAVSLAFNGTTFTAATNTTNFTSNSDQIRTVPTSSATACQSFGRTWSWSEISDANFRARVQASANSLNIDRVRVRACWNGSNVMQASVAGGSTAAASPSATLRAAVDVNHSGPDPNDNWRCIKYQVEGQSAVNVDFAPNHDSPGNDQVGFNVTAPSSRGMYDVSFTPYQNDGCTLPVAAETFTLPDAITVGVFGDSFGITGQNTYTANSWTDGDGGGSNCAVATNSTYGDGFLDDSGYLRLRQNCTQTRSGISTAGLGTIQLKYGWGSDGNPGSLVVEWKPSSSATWTTLATHTLASGFVAPTTVEDWGLGSNAANTTIDIRFTGSTANNSRNALVDNVIVTGDALLTPTVATVIHDGSHASVTSVTPGTAVHDSAAVSGASGAPTGTVTFSWWTNGTCAGAATATSGNLTLVGGSVDGTAFPQTPATSGSYSFRGHYNGDGTYFGADSPCEPLTVKATPTVSTAIHDPSHAVVTSVALGTTVHDSVAVSGSSGTATGDVTFDFWNNGTCSGAAAATSSNVALSSGAADATGFPQGPLGAGSYSFKAHYAGDSNYTTADSLCEPLTVTQATPTVTTEIHDGSEAVVTTSAPLGSTVHDKATVSGVGSFAVTGSVDFTFWSNDSCTGTGTGSGTAISISSGIAHPSTSQGPLPAGDYSFRAHYNGSGNYTTADSLCEPFTVNKAQLTVTTAVHNAGHVDKTNDSVPLGSVMHDTATVSGAVAGFPLPPVSFTLTSGYTVAGGCASGAAVANDGNEGAAHKSADSASLGADEYAYRGSVGGNANYIGDTSACEPFTVNKAQLTVTTAVHNAGHVDKTNDSVPLGSVMHDTATVSGAVAGFPLPPVSFTLTSGYTVAGGCASGAAVANDGNEGAAHKSADSASLGADEYAYRGSVGGNANYIGDTSACEPFTVNKAQLTVTTAVHNAGHVDKTNDSVPLGSVMHDTATVSGAVAGFPLPPVSFTLTSGYTVAGGCASGAAVANDGNEGAAHKSADSASLGADEYAYRGSVGGNANYIGDTSACEPFTVNKAQLTVTTAVHNAGHVDKTNDSVPLGSVMHDTATVSGAVAGFPLPPVSFTLTSGYTVAGGCASGAAVANDGNEGAAHKSADSASLGADEYAYRGSVGGNANYIGDTSACEPFTVNKAQLTVTTAVHNAGHVDKTNDSVPLGSVMHDTATVSGAVAGFPLPPVSFTLTSGYTVAGGCASGAAVANDGNEGAAHKSADSASLGADEYAYRGSVGGNANYIGDTSACEPFTVNKAQLTVTTAVHNAGHVDKTNDSVPLGSVMHDTATVSGAVAGFPLPPVSFTLTSGYTVAGGCASGAAVANDGNEGAAHKSADSASLGADEYAYRGSVGGNANYIGDTSACEPFTVNKAQLTVTTAVHNAGHVDKTNDSVPLGSVMHDTATVSGAVAGFPLPPVSFTLTSGYTVAGGCASGAAVANDGNEGAAHKSADSASLGADEYAYRGSVGGNANYIGDTSACEPFTVNKATPTLVTTLKNAAGNTTIPDGGSVFLGATVYDTATLSGGVAGFSLNGATTVTYDFFGNDACTGSPIASESKTVALDASVPSSSNRGPLAVGGYAFRATYSGNTNYNAKTSACEPFRVIFNFHGFFQPVDNNGVFNSVNAGRAIPVKFDLSGNQGLEIFASGYPKSTIVPCNGSAGVDALEETLTAGNSSLSYSEGQPFGQYHYVWKTDKPWAGTCRRLDLKFIDGTTHSALFKFTK